MSEAAAQPGVGERWRQVVGERTEHACPRCGERFARRGYLHLHVGRAHPEALSAEEQRAFEAVRQAESAWMDHLARHVKSGLVVLPLFLVWLATLVLLIELDANVAWVAMSTPGYVLFGALIYAMAYGYLAGGRESYHGRV